MASPPEFQHTVSKIASFSGTALHTGDKVTLKLHPAPVDHGIKFKRKDLQDEPTIDAKIENLKTVERATTIGEGSVRVHTVEHILAALAAMGVDNAIVEMDANEPPIGDGSAQPYVDLIKRAGLAAQDESRKFFSVREPIQVEAKTGALLVLLPDDKFRISCTQAGPDNRFTQFLSTEITPAVFEREIAPARTFVYYEDVKPLMDKNLIKGGSLENAIVVRGEAVLSKEPLRFNDEFVRHKILDIIGDLALVGRRVRGHVVAVKPGHATNADLARLITREQTRRSVLAAPRTMPSGDGGLDADQVMQILPHRFPFLMVDRIISFENETKCVGVKTVTINEPFFQGHFPDTR
jgi:UDP-3-O-[3-hydroxymyristoyl] N-acetylglucosamine deacetylase / 3-hydroxyacyl-[acyl-carrier-protein] dehydratase